jgi:effector-binding domain-containing protein
MIGSKSVGFSEDHAMPSREPVLRRVPAQRVAFLRGSGSFEDVPRHIMALVAWMTEQDLPTDEVLIGTTYFLGAGDEEPAWEVWGTLPDSVGEREAEDGRPGVKTLGAFQGAVLVSVGPYGDTTSAYERLLEWIEAKGLRPRGPVHEVYLSDPASVPIEELETEIRVEVAWGLPAARASRPASQT